MAYLEELRREAAPAAHLQTPVVSYQRANKETCGDLQTSKLAETCEGLVDVVPKGPQEMHFLESQRWQVLDLRSTKSEQESAITTVRIFAPGTLGHECAGDAGDAGDCILETLKHYLLKQREQQLRSVVLCVCLCTLASRWWRRARVVREMPPTC